MVEELGDLLEVPGHARVPPGERVQAGDRIDHLAHVPVVRIEHDAVRDLVLAHQPVDAVAVERDAEHRLERADMHVRVEDHRRDRRRLVLFACDTSARAASTPAPISTCDAEVGERPAERGQADDRVQPAGRRAHVSDTDEVAGALAAGDHHAVALAAVGPHLHVGEPLGHRDRSHAGRGDLVAARPELEAHRARAGAAGRGRALVALDRRLEALLEQLVDRRLDAVELRDRGRERELARRRSTAPSSRASRGRRRAARPGSRGCAPRRRR